MAVERKADHSPVTAADRQSEEIILEALARVAPGVAVIAEEAVTAGHIPELTGPFFLVDPLDGTNGFVKGRTAFTINIALIEDRRPTFGLVYAPALADFYVTLSPEEAVNARLEPGTPAGSLAEAGFKPIRSRVPDPNALCALVSQSHLTRATERFLEGYNVIERKAVVLVAEVRPDRPRRGRPLPARRPDQRVGHGSRARRAGGCRRHRHQARRLPAPLRQRRARLRQPRLRRLGARAAGAGPVAAGIEPATDRCDESGATGIRRPVFSAAVRR